MANPVPVDFTQTGNGTVQVFLITQPVEIREGLMANELMQVVTERIEKHQTLLRAYDLITSGRVAAALDVIAESIGEARA